MSTPRYELAPEEFTARLAAVGVKHPVTAQPAEYLTREGVAEYLGLHKSTTSKYVLPPADVQIGPQRGWSRATIDAWNKTRPSRRRN